MQVVAENSTTVDMESLNDLISSFVIVSNKTDKGTSSYPTDLMIANVITQFILK